MPHLSLSQRVKLAYILSFLLLSAFSLGLIFATSKLIEDHIFEKQLNLQINHYQNQPTNTNLPSNLRVYHAIADIPEPIQKLINPTAMGINELNINNQDLDYHYAIVNIANGQQRIFILDVNDIELTEQLEQTIGQFILFAFIALLAIFFAIFQLVIKRALKPMHQLIEQINHQQVYQGLNYNHPDDNELGLLNKTLSNYSQRIEDFIRREREFTAFASHELRTPVTIIKGAMALLELNSNHDKQQKPIARINRATANMEDMLEMLLSLSREHHRIESELIKADKLIYQVIEKLNDKANCRGKNLQFEIIKQPPNVERIPAELVLTNLILNAIAHSSDKNIVIALQQSVLFITNSVSENSNRHAQQANQNYGIGLLIIQRICQQQGWQYQTNQAAQTYQASIKFCS